MYEQDAANNLLTEMKRVHTNCASHEDVFALIIKNLRYVMFSDQGVRSIFLTNSDLKNKFSFHTAWVSKEMGTYLGERA